MTDKPESTSTPPPATGTSPPGQDRRDVWLDTSDSLFDDVLTSPGSSDPATSAGPPSSAGSPPQDPYASPPQPPQAYPPVAWPAVDLNSIPVERPNWEVWRRSEAAGAEHASATPPPPLPTTPPPPTAPLPQPPPSPPPARATPAPGGPSWQRPRAPSGLAGSGARRWRSLLVALLFIAGSIGLRAAGGHHPGPNPWSLREPFGSSAPEKPQAPLGPASAVTPLGADVATVSNPSSVRFELIASPGASVDVSYGSDDKDPQTLVKVPLPWAVEAPLSVANSHLTVTAHDEAAVGTDPTAIIMCRIYLDGVKVMEDVGRGSASCDTSADVFRTDRSGGAGAPLAAATTVTPQPGTAPALPTTASSVTFEGYSLGLTSDPDLTFGTQGTSNGVTKEVEALPFAWKASVPAGTDYLGMNLADHAADTPPTFLCRVILDGVVVTERLGPGSVSCSVSVPRTLGS